MCEKVQDGIFHGRPFGGLGVVIKKSLGLRVTVLDVTPNCRCAALNCTFPSGCSVILIAVYFPMVAFGAIMLFNCQNVLVLLITVYTLINFMMLSFWVI